MWCVVITALTSCMVFTILLGWQFAFATAPPGSRNAKDFGAKGAGVTNDTQAIRNATASLAEYDTLSQRHVYSQISQQPDLVSFRA